VSCDTLVCSGCVKHATISHLKQALLVVLLHGTDAH
jgi:hypothetical protein